MRLVERRRFWIKKARRLAFRRNLAHWLDRLLPLVSVVCFIGAVILLICRISRRSHLGLWAGLGLALLVGIATSWYYRKNRRFNINDSLARLDEVGRLHNRLTAAHAGVGDWPAPCEIREPVRWNWRRLAGPVALSVAVLLAAEWGKLPNSRARENAVEPPLAWAQVSSWVQILEQSQLLEPDALQNLRDAVDQVRQKSPESWYSQSTLEAADTLRDKTEQSLKSMLRDLEKSAAALSSAGSPGSSADELKTLDNSMQEALRGLQSGDLQLRKETMAGLKKIDLTKAKQLDPSQMAKIRQNLKAGARVCEKCVGPSVAAGKEKIGESGGLGGGEKTAPLTVKPAPTNLQTEETDTISNDDLSHAAIGDVVGTDKGKHQVKKNAPQQAMAGGAINSTGEGGEAVWRDSLAPEDRDVLKRFFK